MWSEVVVMGCLSPFIKPETFPEVTGFNFPVIHHNVFFNLAARLLVVLSSQLSIQY